MGTLKPGADDHGFVAAVAVTVGVPLICTSPLEADTSGTLNPGAEDQGLVAAVAVTVPLAMTTDVLVTASPPVLPGTAADDPSVPSTNLTNW